MLNTLDIFAGIGGFTKGLESTGGFRTVGFCEQNLHCQKVLARHWPDVPQYDDIRTLDKDHIHDRIDVITGGFPCQDISGANPKAAGLSGPRSSLWYEQLRLIADLQPRYVIAENSHMLRRRGLDGVLRGLAALGYDAEWHCIPASFVGAWHKRDRIWLIAYPHVLRREGCAEEQILRQSDLSAQSLRSSQKWPGRSNLPSPRVSGGDDGVSERTQRNKALGNSVYVPIPEMIGRAILRHSRRASSFE